MIFQGFATYDTQRITLGPILNHPFPSLPVVQNPQEHQLGQSLEVPSGTDFSKWTDEEAACYARSLWSANIENTHFVDFADQLIRCFIGKVCEEVTNPKGVKSIALKVSGSAHFIKLMHDFMIQEGMYKPEDFASMNQKDVRQLGSLANLRMIFDTAVNQKYGFRQWKQGISPSVLHAYPAARLIREMNVENPRPRHEENLGEVRLKLDPWWAEYINDPAIGGFGVPWGPYGFGSGCNQEDVDRKEAIALGLQVPEDDSELYAGAKAIVRSWSPELKQQVLELLCGGPKPRDPKELGRIAATNTRRIMLTRGLSEALARGDQAQADEYRKAIAELPDGPAIS